MHSNGFLAILIGLIVLNQITARSTRLRSKAALFWTLQAINIGVAIYLFVQGVPGLGGQYAQFASFILGLLFLFRAAQNMIIVMETQREASTSALMHMERIPSFYELQQRSQEGEDGAAADDAPADPAPDATSDATPDDEIVTAPPGSPRS